MTTTTNSAREATPRPRSLIVSLFGSYGREVGGRLSVSALIRLMAELDVDVPAVRSSVSRLKRRGLLESARVNGLAGYALSETGWQILAAGDRRIFSRRVATPAEGWVLVVFSVPESQRHKRHLLRSRLAWLGFGTIAAGVWIAPAHLAEQAQHALESLDVTAYVDLFRAEHLAFGDLRQAVAQWWDLAGLEQMYEQFLATHQPVLARWRRRKRVDNAAAFADYLRAVDAWRRMPYLDPGLPPDLLPRQWSGTRAAAVFFELHDRLRDHGLKHVAEVTAAQ